MNFHPNKTFLLPENNFRFCFFSHASNMSDILKPVKIATLVVAAILVFSGLGCAVGDKPIMQYDYGSAQCVAASNGELSPGAFENLSATDRSFLLSCALSTVVGEADRTRKERDRLVSKKQELSDAILSKDIDIGFVGREGNHLLNDVVLSFFPEQWKVNTLKKLIDMGADVNHRNKHGKNAADLAKFRGQDKIAGLLTAK